MQNGKVIVMLARASSNIVKAFVSNCRLHAECPERGRNKISKGKEEDFSKRETIMMRLIRSIELWIRTYWTYRQEVDTLMSNKTEG